MLVALQQHRLDVIAFDVLEPAYVRAKKRDGRRVQFQSRA
jgi:hypothetical protein